MRHSYRVHVFVPRKLAATESAIIGGRELSQLTDDKPPTKGHFRPETVAADEPEKWPLPAKKTHEWS
jgi:hypothetical protein